MNKLIWATINNRILILVLCAITIGLGLFLFREIPVEAFPDVSPNLVQVFTETEGLAPEEVEKYISYPVEQAMNGLPGVEEVRSVSNFGLSVVNIYFEETTDIYFARQLVGERLDEAAESIPEHFGEPKMGPISTGMGLILFYYLEDTTGNYTLEELRTIQDWVIKPALQTITGVTEVLGIGGQEKQYHIVPDPMALLKYDLDINDVSEIVENNNLNVGGQFIEKNAEEYVILSKGLAESKTDLEAIVLKTSAGGTPVLLRDVADVQIGGSIRRGLQTRNGAEEIVAGMVIKLVGTNSSSVIARVEEQISNLNSTLPPGIRIVPYYEQRTIVQDSVQTVTDALAQGIIFVSLVLFLFLGSLRGSIIAALSIPFSVLFAIAGMYFFGITANLMSLGGLAIAIGLLVDGSIVIVENVDRHLKFPDSTNRKNTVVISCLEVVRPIFFSILVVIIVFLPLFTLQGVEGKTFRPLAYSLALAMLGALVFSIFVAPALSSLLLKRADDDSRIAQFYDRFERLTFAAYRPLLRFVLTRKWLVVLAILLLLGGGFYLGSGVGSEFTPELEEGTMVLRLTMAPSISLEESKRLTMTTEKQLLEIPEIRSVVSRIGRGEVGAHSDPINSAEMYIELLPEEQWRQPWSQEELETVIRNEIGAIPGVLTNFTQPIAMSVDELLEGIRAELAIKLYGEDLEQLAHSAAEIAETLRQVPGAADVQVDQVAGTPKILIQVRREVIARYGIPLSQVQSTIEAALGGRKAGELFEGVRRFDIVVRYPQEYRRSLEDIQRLVVRSHTGATVLLQDLAHIRVETGPRQITRQNGNRFITVQCNVSGRDIGSFVEEAQQKIAANVDLPPTYRLTWGGQFRLQQEANARFAIVIPVTLLLILVLIYMNFKTLRSTLIILLNIPLALVGGVIALAITGQNFSVPSSIGFIALFGIAVGNGMVLVTAINRNMNTGVEKREAVIRGALYRLRPVLMTALTTAIGLIPLLFSNGTGSEVQRPLAIVVVGGLVTATIVTLLFLPVLSVWIMKKAERSA